MKKIGLLSITLLFCSSVAYAGKIEPARTDKDESNTKTTKQNWSWWDGVKNVGKSTPDKAITYLREGKLDLSKEKDYNWLASAIMYCTKYASHDYRLIEKLVLIYSILKKENNLLKENLNNIVRIFLQEEAKKKEEKFVNNLSRNVEKLYETAKPILDRLNNTVKNDLKKVILLDKALDLTVEEGKERKETLTEDTIYKNTSMSSFKNSLAAIEKHLNNL